MLLLSILTRLLWSVPQPLVSVAAALELGTRLVPVLVMCLVPSRVSVGVGIPVPVIGGGDVEPPCLRTYS